jgi:hypothetical protein
MTTPVPAATPLTAGNRRDHYYVIKAFVPSDMDVGDDRIRWYFDHAIRGYHRTFAAETDPIRAMGRCSVGVEKVPLAALSAPPPAEPREGEADPADLVAALDSADWSNTSIGNKLLIRAAINALRTIDAAPRPARSDAGEAVAVRVTDATIGGAMVGYDKRPGYSKPERLRDALQQVLDTFGPLSAHPHAVSAEADWQTMETAPKDGRTVLAYVAGLGMGQMTLYYLDGYWREQANGMGLKIDPTHWMPLPSDPPALGAQEVQS